MAGYLFTHFIGEQKDGEQVYFSLSRDGLFWQDLSETPLLKSRIGMCGVRDTFPVRDPETGRVYIIATDLRIEAGLGWGAAQFEGSRDLIVWESDDLIHWSEERACTVGIPEAGCVWAPEAVYDREKKAFLVFFASMVKTETDEHPKQRIYAAYTKDFCEFTDTFLFIERGNHVIDTTILEHEGKYYRISKDETTKRLIMESADSLSGPYTDVPSETLASLEWVEGPEGYLLPDGKTWCLLADQFGKGTGYLPMITENLGTEDFRILEPDQYNFDRMKKRHGGVIPITDEEYERMLKYYTK